MTDQRTPAKPISRTLLEFARPLLRVVGPDPDRETLEGVLRVAVTVWNAVVMEQVGYSGRYLDHARELVEQQALPAAVEVFGSLVEHKHQAFAADRRLVLDYRLVETADGRLGVEVDAGSAEQLAELDDA